jgi:hypothetical protein
LKTGFIFLLFSCYCSLSAQIQSSATIFGKISDAANEPVPEVQVSIVGSTQAPVYSDENGNYEYSVPAGKGIEVVFSNLSYNQEKKNLNLKATERLRLNVSIQLKILHDVEITDDTRTGTANRLDPKIVSYIPSASGDFNTLLFSQPGVSSHNELSSGYSVQGGNYDENLVYVNDIEVYRPVLAHSANQEGLSFINSDMVSSVLFSAGGFNAQYGDKLSSVLDVQYRRPREFSGSASASLLGGNAHLEGASKDYRFTWIFGARYKTDQYLLQNTDVQGAYRPVFADLQSFLTYDITDKWEIDFLGMYSNNRYNVVPQTQETNFGTINQSYRFLVYFNGQEIDEYQTGQAAISAIYHPNNRLKLKFITSAFKTSENESYDILGQYYIDELESDFSKANFGQVTSNIGVGTYLNHARDDLNATVVNAEHKGSYLIGKNRLLWGVKAQREFINYQLSEWSYIDSAGYTLPQGNQQQINLQSVIKSQGAFSNDHLEGFLQYILNKDLRDTSKLTFTSGLRANYSDLNQQTVVSPRGTLAWKPNWKRDFLFRASSGYYYQPPFFNELIGQNGLANTNVRAEQSIHFVLASDYNFKLWNRPFKFVADAYYKILNDMNPYVINDDQIRYLANNSGHGYSTGMDFKINGDFVNGLQSWFSMSIMRAMYEINGDSYYDYYNNDGQLITPGYTANSVKKDSVKITPGYIPLPTDQLVNFAIFFQDYFPKFPDFKMHLSLLFGTSLPFGPPNSQLYKDTLRMPPYRRVDIGFSYQLLKENKKLPKHNPFHHLKSVWMGLEVLNLLQIQNVISYYWVTDVTGRSYAIPNYLTNRQVNARIIVKF